MFNARDAHFSRTIEEANAETNSLLAMLDEEDAKLAATE